MDALADLVWLIPAFPLAGFLLLTVAGRRLGEPLAGWLATAMMGCSFVATLLVHIGLVGADPEERSVVVTLFEWVPAGSLAVDVGFLADPISITMALFVTGVGTLIHLYSIGYMHGDEGFSRFFVYLNLFAFSMLMLVLGDNLLLTFLGWEGVGVCSYLLISFWYSEEANAVAGKKAFLTNRVADWGFLVAMFLAFLTFGTLQYDEIFFFLGDNQIASSTASAMVVLLLVAAAGKSAQFPLQLWLPDAMAGPTPVSALIHAATMVTAGVYLLVRMNPVIAEAGPWVSDLIMWVGLGTALMAASVALAQNDIKKVLAYSTISQLGFMFVAVGTGAYVAAIYHMVTHAGFKALLFLGAGSVIHAMDGDQDLRNYGSLSAFMPITGITFVLGWMGLAGIPPYSGFWSKDEILAFAYNENRLLWLLLLLAALLTAVYSTRMMYLTFYAPRGWRKHETEGGSFYEHLPVRHPHESPKKMFVPLMVLSGTVVWFGLLNLPFSKDWHHLGNWLEPALFHNERSLSFAGGTLWILGGVAGVVAAVGIAVALGTYAARMVDASRLERPILARAWRYDEAVTRFMGGPGTTLFQRVTRFDSDVVDGTVNTTGTLIRSAGARLRTLQAGRVRSYAAGIGLGALGLLAWFISRAGF